MPEQENVQDVPQQAPENFQKYISAAKLGDTVTVTHGDMGRLSVAAENLLASITAQNKRRNASFVCPAGLQGVRRIPEDTDSSGEKSISRPGHTVSTPAGPHVAPSFA